MKNFFAAVAGLALISSNVAAADYGLGVSVQSSDAMIYVPINISESFRVEPSFRYFRDKDERSDEYGKYGSEIKHHEFSVGLFGRTNIVDSVSFFYGGRLAYVKVDTEVKQTLMSDRNLEVDGFRIAPTIGFEYSVTERLSIGVEAEWFFQDLKGDESINDSVSRFKIKNEQQSSGTDTRVVARFLF